jgi:uncharacterized protein YndB with AHSA1/START domain
MSVLTEPDLKTINIVKETFIAASPQIVFQAVVEELGPGSELPDGRAFPMRIELWPGGRWYRDLGNNTGHLWGHVQVIKPPALLEISGPMFMSYPGVNFVQYRLAEEAVGTRLKITHSAFGQIPDEDMKGVSDGWEHGLQRIRELAERRVTAKK